MLYKSCAGLNIASFSKRLSATIINILIYLFIAILFEFTIMDNTYLKWTGYKDLQEEFISLNEEYEDKQDEYNIYIYVDDVRTFNENISETEANNFYNDSRVIYLREIVPEIEKKMNYINYSSYLISFMITPLVCSLLLALIFKKSRNIGCVVNKLVVAKSDSNFLTTKEAIKYALLNWVFLYFLGILTIGIYPAIELGHVYYSKNHLTRLEEKLNICYYDNN